MGFVARTGEKRNTYRILIGRPEGKRLLRRPGLNWKDTIKVELIAVGWEAVDRIHLVQDRDKWQAAVTIYESWNINSGNYLFTTDTK